MARTQDDATKELVQFLQKMSEAVVSTSKLVLQVQLRQDYLQQSIDRLTNILREQQLRAVGERDLPRVTLATKHPVAIHSDDHKSPLGARQDNTHYPRFVRRCEQIFQRPLRALDLGCAGGGLVFDFLTRGHMAIGLEGSDYPKRHGAGEWPLIPNNLFTCDITKPFQLSHEIDGTPCKFEVISMWEVLEHMEEEQLPQLFENIKSHLAPDGIFACSVATFECADEESGAVYHKIVQGKDWWHSKAKHFGFKLEKNLFSCLDFPRGSGNGPMDWSAERDPQMGFHMVLRLASH
ncbi:MAG: class I SAM-dependent methyltransferase [Bdellovibrionota bacterium]|nr:MAG: class I SAM-dependent methyltransferase [Bdellovibrionota bacterium]